MTELAPTPPDAPRTPDWIDVFVSYSRRDGEFVRRLHEALIARGKEVWVDWEDIPATADWRQRIGDGVDSANAFVFVLSPDAIASAECNAELDLALAANKRIVPVVCRDVDPASVRVELASLNWLFFRADDDFDESFSRLVDALETDLGWLDAHTRLLKRARDWDAHGRDRSFLLRGRDLDAAEAWLRVQADHKEPAMPLQVDYIVASRQSSTRRQRITLGAVGTALAVSIGLTIVALAMRSQAISREHTARSRELAVNAVAQLETDPELGLILAREAARAAPTAEAEAALRRLLGGSRIRSRQALHVTPAEMLGSVERRAAVTFSPGGSRALVVTSDGPAIAWTAPSSTARIPSPPGDDQPLGGRPAVAPAFSADGRLAILVRRDGSAAILRTSDWQQLATWNGLFADATLVDGGRMAVTVRNGAIELRRVPGGHVAHRFGENVQGGVVASRNGRVIAARVVNIFYGDHLGRGDRAAVLWRAPWRRFASFDTADVVRLTPDGRLLVTQGAGPGCGFAVRDARTGRVLHRLRGVSSCLGEAWLSPTGAFVVGIVDGNQRVWRTRTGKGVSTLAAAGESSSPVAFSRDDSVLVSSGVTGAAFVWDVARGARLAELRGGGRVVAAYVSPDGRAVTTLSDDGVLRRWSVPVAREVVALRSTLSQVVASGGHVAAVALTQNANGDDVAHLWRAEPTQGALVVRERALALDDASGVVDGFSTVALSQHRSGEVTVFDAGRRKAGPIGTAQAVSPDGRFVAVLREDGRIDVEGLDPRRHIGTVRGADDFDSLALGPDGSLLVSVRRDGAATIWDVATGRRQAPIRGEAWNATFSHDGRRLVVTGVVARVLDAHTGDLVTTFQGPVGVDSAEFSADDRLVVVTGRDGTVRIWDAVDGTLLQTLYPPDKNLGGATFDDRAATIVTWGDFGSGSLRVYDCDVCGDLHRLERRADARITRPLTPAERRRYGL